MTSPYKTCILNGFEAETSIFCLYFNLVFNTNSLRFVLQTFCSNADFTKVDFFFFMYMNSGDVIICYLELRKIRSVFPIPLEFEISKFACTCNSLSSIRTSRYIHIKLFTLAGVRNRQSRKDQQKIKYVSIANTVWYCN